MSFKELKKKEDGFTIIEVLIVLAIAGLIMLIVFLAVPALQRNQRNSARTTEAARVSAAVTECLGNSNGTVASCDSQAELAALQLSAFDSVTFNAASAAYSQSALNVYYGRNCDAAGQVLGAASSAGSRAFAVTFQLEPAINRCIAS